MDKKTELISNIAFTMLYSSAVTVYIYTFALQPSMIRTFVGIAILISLIISAGTLYRFWWIYVQDKPLFELPSSEEYLLIGRDQIPWPNIGHISLKRSEAGNVYAAVYFKNDRPPKGFNIENIKDKEAFISHLEENASEKGFTLEIKNNL
jgi:hypothetical protein